MLISKIPVLGFAAYSGTGKTTLLTRLLPLLTARGLRIGLIKHAHHEFDLDTPGKDSYELRKAGTAQILVASHKRRVLITEKPQPEDPPLQPELDRLEQQSLDLVLVEGFKHERLPKIELVRPALGRPLMYPTDPDIIAVATDAPLPAATALPRLDLNDPAAVADFLLAWAKAFVPPDIDPRDELVRHYRWLRQYGCNDSHSGNASVRLGDAFWVSPTGACADILQASDLIRCPLEGPCTPGASLDASLHQAVYRANPKAGAVLHSHGAYTVASTLNGRDFEPVDFEGQYYFERVPVLSIPYDRYVAEAPGAVAGALANHRVTVVRGHGVYACAETVNLAYKWTCSLELSARTLVIARQAGTLQVQVREDMRDPSHGLTSRP
jgi:L-fuculose-phosphate aldolase